MGVPSGDGTDLTLPDVVVRIRDLAGRPRGVGFLADHQGTLITAHEAVDGLPRIVLYGAGDRTCIVTSDAVTALPELDLALVHTEGLATDPLPVTVRREVPTGTYVRLAAGCWREARVLSATPATYTATDRFHLLPHTLELAIGTTGRDALRLGGGAAGGPVLDAATGTVVAILGTALQSDHRDVGFAIPLRGAATKSAALTELLLRNAATVPAYGVDLNLAGVLELTATSVGSDGPPGALAGYVGGWPGEGGEPLRGAGVGGGEAEGGVWGGGVGRGEGAESVWAAGVGGGEEAGAAWAVGVEEGDSARGTGRGCVGGGEAEEFVSGSGGGEAAGAAWATGVDEDEVPGSVWAAGVGESQAAGPAWGVGEGDSVKGARRGCVGGGAAGSWFGNEGGARGVGREGAGSGVVLPVERGLTVREFAAFSAGSASVLALVGPPGSGRTTELAALAARRYRAAEPAPTLWLRGADLRDEDESLADAAGRALRRAARIVTTSQAPTSPPDPETVTPADLSHTALTAGRPLFLLLDGPEEMPPVLAHRLAAWTEGTVTWLRETGARLVVACRAEYWEAAGRGFPKEMLHGTRRTTEPTVHEADAANLGDGSEPGDLTAASPHSGTSPHPEGRSNEEPTPVEPKRPYPASETVTPTPHPAPDDRAATPTQPTAPITSATPALLAAPPPNLSLPTPNPHLTSHLTPHLPARPAFEDKAPSGPERGAGGAAPRDGKGRGGGGEGILPDCIELGEFTPREAEVARARYRVPAFALAPNAVHHPLTIHLLSEIRTALPDVPPPTNAEREDIFAAHLDLMCLRIAVRLAAANNLRGTPVKRLAAKVSGQVHEAARRSLGPGQGELDRSAFEDVFPWGHAPQRLGGVTGWASAVLAEGLIVPAGTGYRFAHEELADWIQGMHLDLEEALRSLAHTPRDTHMVPVPHHRIGPVVQSLLLVARQQGPAELTAHLRKLTQALDETPDAWWPARLLTETLRRVPDATPYLDVLHALADHVVARTAVQDTPRTFLPEFWTALNLPPAPLFTLLRHLLRADPPPGAASTPRYLDAVASLLAADAGTVQPHLTLWFEDDRPLPGAPQATVAAAAQALLYAYRHRALDDLTEVLVGCGHRRADELLGALAEDEPSAVCRAVDRWARDTRPSRRVAAVSYGLRAAPHVTTDADRDLLRYAAEELLTEVPLQGGALGLLVQDPRIRTAHLPQTLAHFTAADPQLPPTALLPALKTNTEPVLKAFRTRLARPDTDPTTTLRALAEVTTQPLARRIAIMVRETVERRPETARAVAAYVDDRLKQGPPARPVLHPLVTALLTASSQEVRSALAGVLATPDDAPLRTELREFLLTHEQDPAVLTSFLHAAAHHRSRDLVHRAGRLLVRTPDGATRFDRGLVDLGRHVPGFAARVAGWIGEAPQEWATVVGPGARRMIENLAGAGIPA
ncbi:hypothetical protein [Streptomyces acidiscabies]|uniref:Large Pro/Ala/Gly-rich protein n=2 Tax=Streptomyces acidiscabies TaxID=42234 RepID=A0AAP6BHX5_9ACTN|nr:hypothetical protein [Streptomyces acidiscabies]MDX2965069.1 hypothetical protein [Streptomyces acidiscabies]MDX3022562.1 hypothetical protein [Streptomyces acidiscabies]MDX3796648.1 hypothetical protein [Streptomyces acidiscabies]